ncbi:MAG: heparinase II/III-family protein, partial [Planctomycetes bacterium]|nr:heparinase II/III-family protein [Planctomycetota bacterium]
KAILLRFADVFPEYLVRAGYGYGEYAGMDPHVAAERITNLPQDELVYPPNKPDRKIFTGFWSASRIGTSGTDGSWAARVTEAYDLTCTARDKGRPVYTDDERMHIERDVLLESVYLAVCDERINNKAVANRAGAAVVGMCVGQPELVRFGLEGFRKTVDEWFLPDGGTSESPAYAMMTMSGVRPFALAFRDYSDPPGYVDSDGKRLDHFDACRDTLYGDCWQSLIGTLQGDLRFPPSADSYRTTTIDSGYAEMLALLMPGESHFALLKEKLDGDLSRHGARDAIFYRQAGLEPSDIPSLELHDEVFPYLAQGYLRSGQAGRQSLLMLSASDWGNHHHDDSLNLYYWKEGRELLSDLGYLWDHPDKHRTSCTFAHNLVMIDGREQIRRGRGGSYHLFSVTPQVKVMEASSQANGPDCVYRRTCVAVDHGPSGDYVLDIFRAGGGETRDYVFHGPAGAYQIDGLSLASVGTGSPPGPELPLTDMRAADGSAPWRMGWSLDGYHFHVFVPGHDGEQVLVGDGWGQRDHRNTDRGATLPYVVRRRQGQAACDIFVTVFAGGSRDKPLVESVQTVPLETGDSTGAVAVQVTTCEGVDLIVSSLEQSPITLLHESGRLTTDGRFAAIVAERGKAARAVLLEGTRLDFGRTHL